MAINKVIYDDDTLIDLTEDTVTPEKLLSGETAHNAAGNRVTGTAVKGHTIQDSSGTTLTQRDAIQFKDMAVSDDSTNNKIVVRQTQVVNTEAEWNQMLANDEVDPNVTYYLPWMSTSDYAEDRTPVGTVIQVTGNYDDTTTRQKSWYPHLPDSEDYLICNGYQPRIEYYPELFDHFAEVYGSGYYFNDLVPIGRFAVPDFRTDFPTNGMLFIKAKTTSTRITYAEVDDERITENNVWSAEKVNDTKADNSVIAPVESGTTASRAYAAGAHFIRDSAFCTAKTAIAQGEAFTLNTNYTAENVGESLEKKYRITQVNFTALSSKCSIVTNSLYRNAGCVSGSMAISVTSAIVPWENILGGFPLNLNNLEIVFFKSDSSDFCNAYLNNGVLKNRTKTMQPGSWYCAFTYIPI